MSLYLVSIRTLVKFFDYFKNLITIFLTILKI